MAAERLSMRTIKEVLRLKWEKKFSNQQISQSCNIARSTNQGIPGTCQKRWSELASAPDLDDGSLEAIMFPPAPTKVPDKGGLPAMEYLRKQLNRKGVTL